MTIRQCSPPCYNELDNVEELYRQVRDVMANVGRYPYERVYQGILLDDTSMLEMWPQVKVQHSLCSNENTLNTDPLC